MGYLIDLVTNARALLQHVVPIVLEPVRLDDLLSLLEGHGAVAALRVRSALRLVFGLDLVSNSYGFFNRMSSYGAVKYKSGFNPTPGSSTRGPTPCSVAGSKIGACMTRSCMSRWI